MIYFWKTKVNKTHWFFYMFGPGLKKLIFKSSLQSVTYNKHPVKVCCKTSSNANTCSGLYHVYMTDLHSTAKKIDFKVDFHYNTFTALNIWKLPITLASVYHIKQLCGLRAWTNFINFAVKYLVDRPMSTSVVRHLYSSDGTFIQIFDFFPKSILIYYIPQCNNKYMP